MTEKNKGGRRKKPRHEVWEVLLDNNYDPVKRLMMRALDPQTSVEMQVKIDLELLSYIAAKPRAPVQLAAETINPMASLLKSIADQGRPAPPKENDDEDDS